MPRRTLIRQDQFPYHVTTRTNNKTWFQIPISQVWEISKEALVYSQQRNPVTIHAFVLMSNHYHLLLSTPNSDIDKFMQVFNFKLSNLINKYSGAINHKFSNRYKWTIIENENYLYNVYRYIYQNPVRAKITKDCISYSYSSIHFLQFEKKQFNFRPHFTYQNDKDWLEKRYNEDLDLLIRSSLKKKYFKLNSKTPVLLKKILERSL